MKKYISTVFLTAVLLAQASANPVVGIVTCEKPVVQELKLFKRSELIAKICVAKNSILQMESKMLNYQKILNQMRLNESNKDVGEFVALKGLSDMKEICIEQAYANMSELVKFGLNFNDIDGFDTSLCAR